MDRLSVKFRDDSASQFINKKFLSLKEEDIKASNQKLRQVRFLIENFLEKILLFNISIIIHFKGFTKILDSFNETR